MKIGVPKETYPGENRVALTPDVAGQLAKKGHDVIIEKGAGVTAGFPDDLYTAKKAGVGTRQEVFQQADMILQVRMLGANPDKGEADLKLMRKDQIIIGAGEPLSDPAPAQKMAEADVTAFALELVPRITRAQSMDILSSMATVAGYKAVLWAAEKLPKFFPMFMTAAGTISPARVFVLGAGVAGLQAIASAKRIGAVVHAYDVRPVVKEQVESLGGKFVELDLETDEAQDKGGYAKEMGDDFLAKQREMMLKVVAESDVVITTAAVPGRKAPILVTEEMVKGMRPGSVIVDLAAERGGNCELTKPGEDVDYNGVTIMGPLNVATTIPYHASQMYAKNITTFLLNLFTKEGELDVNLDDEIIADTMISRGGEVTNDRIREMMGQDGDAGKEA